MRRAPGLETSPTWTEATAAAPCALCGATAGCASADDDPAYVRCLIVPSSLPMTAGGWLHVLAAGGPAPPRRRATAREGPAARPPHGAPTG